MLLRYSVLTPEVRAIKRTLAFGCKEYEEEVGQVDDGVELRLEGAYDEVIRGWMAVFVLVSRLARTLPSTNSVHHALVFEWIALPSSEDGLARLEADLAKRMSGDPPAGNDTPVWVGDFDCTTAADILWIERVRALREEISPTLIRYIRQDIVQAFSATDSSESEPPDGDEDRRGGCHMM